MDIIITDTIRSTGATLTNELIDQVKGTLRKLQNKLPHGTLGKKGEECRMMVAIEIACRLTGSQFQIGQFLKPNSISESEYQKTMTTCKAALGITQNFVNATEVLALQYSPDLVDDIKPILSQYQIMYVDKLQASQRGYVKLDAPLYICAAFWLVAETRQIKIDKAALCKLAETTVTKVQKLVADMKRILEEGCEGGQSLPTKASAVPPGASRGHKQLHAFLNNKAIEAELVATGGAAVGRMRPLHEVQQNALQELSRAQANTRFSGHGGSSSSSLDDVMKAGLKRNLSTMQHALVSAGDVENVSQSSAGLPSASSSTSTTVSTSRASLLADEAAAKKVRGEYEAWLDSMKKAKLAR